MGRWWIRPILAVAVLALAVWQVSLLLGVLHGSEEGPGVETVLVARGPFLVGITREGTLDSADLLSVRAPRSGSTLTWVIDDGSEVAEGDVVAKIDVSRYEFRVEGRRLDYQSQVARVEQERRERGRDRESATMRVDQVMRSFEVLTRAQLTETEQGEAEIGFRQWDLTWAETDYDKYSRLSLAGIVPLTDADLAERRVRSREYALGKSEKDVSYLDAEHDSERGQSRADIDAAEFEEDVAERRISEAVKSAEDRAAMSKRRLEEMEEQLAAGELRAPKAGIVILGKTWGQEGRRSLQAGDRIWHARKICDITGLASLQAKVRVDEASVSRLELGQEAVIRVDDAPGREFQGELTGISAVAREVNQLEDPRAVPGERVFDVSVKVLDPDTDILRPGANAKVQLVFSRVPETLYVPKEAVYANGEDEVVYVQQDGRFSPRRVETGARNDEAVVIVSGLEEGERVALSDPTRLEEE
jgi:RND family efflux transporter MFP subunit